MSNDVKTSQTKIIFRVYKDKSLDSIYSPEETMSFIQKYLKPWMRASKVKHKDKEFCQIAITEELDAGAALCDVLNEEFILSDLDELTKVNVARCAHGYYDFFDAEDAADEICTNKLVLRARWLLKGYDLHVACVKATSPVDYEKLKKEKPKFVSWLVEQKNMSKQEAINLINKDIPELIEAESDFPEFVPELWEDSSLSQEERIEHSFRVLRRIFTPEQLAQMGFDVLTDKDYDNLFNDTSK